MERSARRRQHERRGARGTRLLRRASRRAMTLIEILIVLALIGLVMGAVVVGSGQLGSARRRHSATMIAGAIRIAFTQATATSKSIRLVMDFKENAIWLEAGDQPHLVETNDAAGTGGAAASTEAEKAAVEESSRILKGPTAPKTSFTEIEPMGLAASAPGKGHKALERGITFRAVQTAHDKEPITAPTGQNAIDDGKRTRAYLYFWPGGQTERAVIQLRVGESTDERDAVTLVVSPLTGKVTVRDGAVALEKPLDDKEASEREDTGF